MRISFDGPLDSYKYGMYVNLLRFSTFCFSFCFHAAPVFTFCGMRYIGVTPCECYDSVYNKILLLCITQDQTDAHFLNIPDNEFVPVLTSVFTGNFLLVALYLGCKTNHKSTALGYLLCLLIQGYQGPFL